MRKLLYLITLFLLIPSLAFAAIPNEFVDGQVADADDVNENFNYLETKFSTTGGHDHDGTDAKYITVLGTIPGTLNVTGTTTLSGTINLSNDINATGDIVIAGTFTTSEINVTSLTPSKPVFTSSTSDLVTTGTVPMSQGGSGANLTNDPGGVIYCGGSVLTVLADGTAGKFLQSAGTSAPSWQKVDLAASTDVTGTVPVANGGTAATVAVTGLKNLGGMGMEYFASSGTFTVPAGITTVFVTMVAGGGGGGSGSGGGGGGGGGGESLINFPHTVTPAAGLTVTVGAKGTGGTSGADGTDGADSVFDSLTVDHGNKGVGGANQPGGDGGGAVDQIIAVTQSEGIPYFEGGEGADGGGGLFGGGGASRFGAGGGVSAENASGKGGGGAGGSNGADGGDGTAGFVLVMY